MRRLNTFAVALALAAHAAPSYAQGRQADTAAASHGLRPVSFAKIAANIPVGKPWAQLQYDDLPFQCRPDRVLTWDAKANERVQDPELERVFRDELSAAGMSVSGDPTNLFETDEKSSDLQVGALITDISATFCEKHTLKDSLFSTNRVLIAGSATLSIEWQIYSTLAGRVIARIPTKGDFATKTGLDAGDITIIDRAFAENVRALAKSESFRQILSTAPTAAAAPAPLMIPTPAPIARSAVQAGPGVATIFVGEAMGSGFLISPEGYLLTNQHLVGDARHVRIRWADKTETVADVLRADRRRDVALLKVAPGAHPILVLRHEPAVTGETVFAIGTPLDRDFQNTVTRGVVSGTRVIDGLPFVQSDVAVDHGNSGGPLLDEKGQVIAITDWGYAPDGVSHDLNFFIPIDEALKALNLQPAPAAGAVTAASHRR